MTMQNTAVAALAALALASPTFAADAKAKPAKKDPKLEKLEKRGEYLVTVSGCHDCHSPKTMTPEGPVPDMTRQLSGSPADPKLPAPPKLPAGPWLFTGSADMTAWAGPWGISFARNLTSDKETGLGDWTAQNFIDTLRTGKRMGKGRMLLPPMPWQGIGKMTDDDLKAVFAYLQSIPAVSNAVREPEPPAAPPPAAKK